MTLFVKTEYIVSTNIKEVTWLKTLLEKLNFPQVTTIIIYTNNQRCIILINNPVLYSYTKYINIHYHFI